MRVHFSFYFFIAFKCVLNLHNRNKNIIPVFLSLVAGKLLINNHSKPHLKASILMLIGQDVLLP